MLRRSLLLTIFILQLGFSATVKAGSVVVIVNKNNQSDSLSSDLVGDIYLGRKKRFPTGELVEPLDLPKDLEITSDFYKKVVKKTPAQLRAHWSRLVFTGKGRPPKRIVDEAAVKTMVAEDKKLIGYVNEVSVDKDVKVILEVP
ncbi:hypothetical protein [Aliiglaciecola litoralis]|uniref:Phosphate ABC transporter substrate-binding protein n=1 Tax=Aliiglaciecola litoralis TaxID=582857 RepID=A0ABP3X5G1_9ALTE